MGVLKTTVHHWIVVSTIHVHCNSLKPILIEENKWARLKMALYLRDHKDPTKYQDMHDQIHLDEKWVFTHVGEGEVPPFSQGEKPKALHKTQIAYHKGNVLVCCCEALI